MDASSVNAASSLVTSVSADNTAGSYALKKAMQSQEQSAAQLINSLPQPEKPKDPSAAVGGNVDVKA